MMAPNGGVFGGRSRSGNDSTLNLFSKSLDIRAYLQLKDLIDLNWISLIEYHRQSYPKSYPKSYPTHVDDNSFRLIQGKLPISAITLIQFVVLVLCTPGPVLGVFFSVSNIFF